MRLECYTKKHTHTQKAQWRNKHILTKTNNKSCAMNELRALLWCGNHFSIDDVNATRPTLVALFCKQQQQQNQLLTRNGEMEHRNKAILWYVFFSSFGFIRLDEGKIMWPQGTKYLIKVLWKFKWKMKRWNRKKKLEQMWKQRKLWKEAQKEREMCSFVTQL